MLLVKRVKFFIKPLVWEIIFIMDSGSNVVKFEFIFNEYIEFLFTILIAAIDDRK